MEVASERSVAISILLFMFEVVWFFFEKAVVFLLWLIIWNIKFTLWFFVALLFAAYSNR